MNYSKGDIVVIPVPFTDNEGYKLRPAVVVSDETVHQTGDVSFPAITPGFNPGCVPEVKKNGSKTVG